MKEFEELLAYMAESIIKNTDDAEKLTPTAFELKIYNYLRSRLDKSQVEYSEGSTSFPDVVVLLGAQKYGIEVKLSRSKSWRTIGNSIMEGTAKTVDMIYVFMGKINSNKLDIRYRRYEDCIDNIVVTHSPRYHLDINLQDNENIFTKMNSSYESFRALDERGKIAEVKSYYRSINDTDYWWIDSDDEEIQTPPLPLIRFVRDLQREQYDFLRTSLLVMYPEVVFEKTSGKVKYKNAAVWLVKQGYIHSGIRDMFSSNSKSKEQFISNKKYLKVYSVLFRLIPNIRDMLENMSVQDVHDIYQSMVDNISFDGIDIKGEFGKFSQSIRDNNSDAWLVWQKYMIWFLVNVDEVEEHIANKIVHYHA